MDDQQAQQVSVLFDAVTEIVGAAVDQWEEQHSSRTVDEMTLTFAETLAVRLVAAVAMEYDNGDQMVRLLAAQMARKLEPAAIEELRRLLLPEDDMAAEGAPVGLQ
ncbi:hypothetical protein [Xanthobacter flavus]|uniref:hypothetical protein n=1 Tax=Xanthobacter flavus TaxID=281 RepID=UPI0037262CFA